MKKSTFFLSMALVAMAYLMSACQSMQTASQALMLTNDQVASMVASSVKQMDAQNKVAPANSPYTERLNRLTGDIASVGNTPLNFKVYLTNEVNAFACADGSVRVYSGIMDMMTDDELLGIIGHEIGHVGLEHTKKQIQQQIITNAALDGLASLNNTTQAISQSQLGQMGKQLVTSLATAKYSRTEENEADDFGYEFLQYCGRNPYCMVEAFEKMQALENSAAAQGGNNQNYIARWFSSHPDTASRIKHMKQRCAKDGYQAPVKQTTVPATTKSSSKSTTKSSSKSTKK